MSRVRVPSWRGTGLLRGVGLPEPSGGYRVGCVDVAHQFEREDPPDVGGLLVRLFYPTAADPTAPAGAGGEGGRQYEYASWLPDKHYVHGYLEYTRMPLRGMFAKLVSAVMDPRMPALNGAPLLPGQWPSPPIDGSGAGEAEGACQADEDPDSAPPTRKPLTHPVVVFSHGLGGMRTCYSGICCDIASHGYIVLSVEHRDRSASLSLKKFKLQTSEDDEDDAFSPPSISSSSPSSHVKHIVEEWVPFYHKPEEEKEFPLRNKQLMQRCRDVQRALDLVEMLNEGVEVENLMGVNFDLQQFQGRFDMTRLAVAGHSFGGCTTIQALLDDPRLSCGIAMDCWMIPLHRDIYIAGVHKPLLFVNSFSFQWPENVHLEMKLTKEPNAEGVSHCQVITLEDTNHFSQTDVLFTMPSFFFKMRSAYPPLDPTAAHLLNMRLCHDFFKRYLIGDSDYQRPVPNLDGGEGAAEHLIFGTNVDLQEVDGASAEGGVVEEGQGSKSHL